MLEDCQQNILLKEFWQNSSDNILSTQCPNHAALWFRKNKVDPFLQLHEPSSHSHCQLASVQWIPIQIYHDQYHPVGNYLETTARHLTQEAIQILQKTINHPHYQIEKQHSLRDVHLPHQHPHHIMAACSHYQSSFLLTPNVKCRPYNS